MTLNIKTKDHKPYFTPMDISSRSLESPENEPGVPGSHRGSVIAEQQPGSFSSEPGKVRFTVVTQAPTSLGHALLLPHSHLSLFFCFILEMHLKPVSIRESFLLWDESLPSHLWSSWGLADAYDTQETTMLSRGQASTLKLNEPGASLLLKWFKLAFYQLRGCEITLGSGNFLKWKHSIWSGQQAHVAREVISWMMSTGGL